MISPMLGVAQNFKDINKLMVLEGRFIFALDLLMPFCVVTDKVRDRLTKAGMTKVVGAQILVKKRVLTICGVIQHEPMGGMRPDGLDSGILIPIFMAFRMTCNPGVQAILVKFKQDTTWQTASNEIKGYFARTSQHIKVDVRSAEQLIQQQRTQMQLFTLLLGAIGSISLIVGGVGVMNGMLVLETERRKEIGIRWALGALRKDIQQQFLTESFLLCIADGIFFGYYPARQAARLSPIEALRSEYNETFFVARHPSRERSSTTQFKGAPHAIKKHTHHKHGSGNPCSSGRHPRHERRTD